MQTFSDSLCWLLNASKSRRGLRRDTRRAYQRQNASFRWGIDRGNMTCAIVLLQLEPFFWKTPVFSQVRCQPYHSAWLCSKLRSRARNLVIHLLCSKTMGVTEALRVIRVPKGLRSGFVVATDVANRACRLVFILFYFFRTAWTLCMFQRKHS